MKVIDEGHVYSIDNINYDTKNDVDAGTQTITFVKRFRSDLNHSGTLNQELIRVLIDRVIFLNKEVEWEGNNEILYHLRMALILHESRALFRKVHKGEMNPENIETDIDGHFKLIKT